MGTSSKAAVEMTKWKAFCLHCNRIDRQAERWLLLTFYAIIIITIAIEVFRRFVMNYSSPWGEELARYSFIYLSWLAAAAAVRDRAHIRIDVFVNLCGPHSKRIAWWLTDFATLVFAVWALWLSIAPVLTSINFGSITPGLRVSRAFFLAAVPTCCALIVLRVLQSMVEDIGRIRRGEPVFDGRKLFD